jgi:hypothetical protein
MPEILCALTGVASADFAIEMDDPQPARRIALETSRIDETAVTCCLVVRAACSMRILDNTGEGIH